MKREKVLRKVQKLLALAGNNPNEHERLAAMEGAYKMLSDHNLAMADVVGQGVADDAANRYRLVDQSVRESRAREVWLDVAALCYCQVLWSDSVKPWVPLLLGTKDNTDSTIELARWFVRTIKAEAKRRYKDDAALRRSFSAGSEVAIDQKVKLLFRREREKAYWSQFARGTAAGTSLVVLRNSLQTRNEETKAALADKLEIRQVEAAPVRPVEVNAYRAGLFYGSTLEVNRVTSKDRRIGG